MLDMKIRQGSRTGAESQSVRAGAKGGYSTCCPKPQNAGIIIIVHPVKIGANGVHSPTHFPALMQLVDLLERVVVDQD